MAVNFSALNTVYNHYLPTYAGKSSSPYDTHKKSELRGVYNSIVKLNKESPLCILDTSKESQAFAVGIKENARMLRNTIASLGGLDEDELLNKKTAFSSNDNIAEAKFIGEYNPGEEPFSFDIEVHSLAAPQTNMGNFLPSGDKTGLPAGAYSFDISINDLNYEFQFNVGFEDTNKNIQDKLARLITGSQIGVNARTIEDGEGNSSLILESAATGKPENRSLLFQVTDDKTSKQAGAVSYLGIQEVTRPPCNAEFMINGTPHSAYSNTFSVEKTYEVRLNGTSSEGETASIGLKADVDSLSENISHLVSGYNDFVRAAADYVEKHPKSRRLVNEMRGIGNLYRSGLHNIGLEIQNTGEISLNKDHLHESVVDGEAAGALGSVKGFANSVLRKTNQVSLNPMNYVDKTIVAYKNPGKNFATPYITSAYSGMMFNGYC